VGENDVRYIAIIERAANNYSAYVPDLPGCITTGATVEETARNIREAIEFHLEGMREDGLPIPQPQTVVAEVEVKTEDAHPSSAIESLAGIVTMDEPVDYSDGRDEDEMAAGVHPNLWPSARAAARLG